MRKLVPILVLLVIAAAVYFFVKNTSGGAAPEPVEGLAVEESEGDGGTVLGRAYKRSDRKINEIYGSHDDEISKALESD